MKTDTQSNNLTNVQKKFLRKLEHNLKPVVYIGKEGLTEEVDPILRPPRLVF